VRSAATKRTPIMPQLTPVRPLVNGDLGGLLGQWRRPREEV